MLSPDLAPVTLAHYCRTHLLLASACLGLLACGRARKPSVDVSVLGSPNPHNSGAKAVVSTSSPTMTPSQTTVASPLEFPHTAACLDLVDEKLEHLSWFEVASQSCFPGSKRLGAVTVRTVVRDHPSEVEMPAGAYDNCWVALVTAPSLNTTLVVELLDVDGAPHRFETIAGTRGVVPSRGTFCSLQGHFRRLRFQTDSQQRLRLNVAWYSIPSSLP
jgi:hypothetical protein